MHKVKVEAGHYRLVHNGKTLASVTKRPDSVWAPGKPWVLTTEDLSVVGVRYRTLADAAAWTRRHYA